MGLYTQQTEGAAIAADAAETATALSGLPLLNLAAETGGAQPSRTVTVRLPVTHSADGAALDVSRLTGASLTVEHSVLLDRVMDNSPSLPAPAASEQTVLYRDKAYVFAEGAESGAFTLLSIELEGDTLLATLRVDGSLLKTGYYRLLLAADATGEQVAWAPVDWIDGDGSVSVSVSDVQLYEWETFTVAMAEYESQAKSLLRMFQHAWGGYTDKLYHGLRVPDFPPVYRSLRLSELVTQLRAAAAAEVSPLIRYTFEVFVPGP
jgi:hypothetical protein